MFILQDIVENVRVLKDEGNDRDSIVSRTLVSQNLVDLLFVNNSWPNVKLNVHSFQHSMSVFRARVLGKLYRGEETRYDVQIIHTYRNRFRLEHREFLWVPNVCDCPHLEDGRQYILMVRRHINYEQTLNRILLEDTSYVVAYRPREDELLRPLERLCSNRGAKQPAELRGWVWKLKLSSPSPQDQLLRPPISTEAILMN